jgi:hypothetical protein
VQRFEPAPYWEKMGLSPEISIVFLTIAEALGERTPNPDLLRAVVPECRPVIPGHNVTIKYAHRSPKGTRPRRRSSFTISIQGIRVDGIWYFTIGQLVALLSDLRRAPARNDEARSS